MTTCWEVDFWELLIFCILPEVSFAGEEKKPSGQNSNLTESGKPRSGLRIFALTIIR